MHANATNHELLAQLGIEESFILAGQGKRRHPRKQATDRSLADAPRANALIEHLQSLFVPPIARDGAEWVNYAVVVRQHQELKDEHGRKRRGKEVGREWSHREEWGEIPLGKGRVRLERHPHVITPLLWGNLLLGRHGMGIARPSSDLCPEHEPSDDSLLIDIDVSHPDECRVDGVPALPPADRLALIQPLLDACQGIAIETGVPLCPFILASGGWGIWLHLFFEGLASVDELIALKATLEERAEAATPAGSPACLIWCCSSCDRGVFPRLPLSIHQRYHHAAQYLDPRTGELDPSILWRLGRSGSVNDLLFRLGIRSDEDTLSARVREELERSLKALLSSSPRPHPAGGDRVDDVNALRVPTSHPQGIKQAGVIHGPDSRTVLCSGADTNTHHNPPPSTTGGHNSPVALPVMTREGERADGAVTERRLSCGVNPDNPPSSTTGGHNSRPYWTIPDLVARLAGCSTTTIVATAADYLPLLVPARQTQALLIRSNALRNCLARLRRDGVRRYDEAAYELVRSRLVGGDLTRRRRQLWERIVNYRRRFEEGDLQNYTEPVALSRKEWERCAHLAAGMVASISGRGSRPDVGAIREVLAAIIVLSFRGEVLRISQDAMVFRLGWHPVGSEHQARGMRVARRRLERILRRIEVEGLITRRRKGYHYDNRHRSVSVYEIHWGRWGLTAEASQSPGRAG